MVNKFSGVKEGKLKGHVATRPGAPTNFPLERMVKVHITNSNDSQKVVMFVDAPISSDKIDSMHT